MDDSDLMPQSALLLTDQEWSDLAYMLEEFRGNTHWIDNDWWQDSNSEAEQTLRRQRALAQRIIDVA
jgi:hypothetical protein